MRGFGASAQGQDMAIYLTPDGEHAIIGTLVDSEGSNLTEAQLDEHVRAPLEPKPGSCLKRAAGFRMATRMPHASSTPSPTPTALTAVSCGNKHAPG